MTKMYRKRYGIYDMYHKSFFTFSIDDDEDGTKTYKSFATKELTKEAIQFCNIAFFSKPHKFIVKPLWEKVTE